MPPAQLVYCLVVVVIPLAPIVMSKSSSQRGNSDCSGSSVNCLRKWSWWQLIVLPFCNWTLNDTGPELSMTWPGNHVSPLLWFLTNTFSPSENWRTLECLSRSNCCLLCFSTNFSSNFGLSKSNLEQRSCPTTFQQVTDQWLYVVWFCIGTEIVLFDHPDVSTHWWLAVKPLFKHL